MTCPRLCAVAIYPKSGESFPGASSGGGAAGEGPYLSRKSDGRRIRSNWMLIRI